jgi:hypothetical protein
MSEDTNCKCGCSSDIAPCTAYYWGTVEVGGNIKTFLVERKTQRVLADVEILRQPYNGSPVIAAIYASPRSRSSDWVRQARFMDSASARKWIVQEILSDINCKIEERTVYGDV